MSDKNELVVIDIKPEQAPALYISNGLDGFLNKIRESVNEVPDTTTKKGRDRIASLAAQVSRSKTAIEKPGREYLKRLKEAVRPAEQEMKRFVDACNELRDEVRKPLTDWEAEQEHIKREEKARKAAAELAKQVEVDHEIALLMNEKFDRDFAEKKAELERQRVAYEEEIKQQAAEQARIDAERKASAEIEAAEQREAEAKAAAERAEREKLEALKRAELEKQAAIEAERRKAATDEHARLAEIQHQKDEEKRRRADIDHRKRINNESLQELIKTGISEECAMNCIKAIASGKTSHLKIIY
ncbi:hypothetical protein GPY51_10875 [Photorhabdus laumondii subsp. laumondii]|uniref:Cell envelope biogenesis protein TolA n=1 Tax=Photorhabdus laumondii subsp. laumondii TaxID=141679 RepID=A0A6L9JJ95_PHOLM|nr:hypothetical protein [Photorhabdus laumondii]MCC8384622.1 hypothetical protein [Photorhabdus laumondii]MCC8413332.1 hypothetical protein [Photorhabdus laumondii]NDK94998.1 hypothetical protein [Photorhabdus laumondii subsp. laumondii]NDL21290.1 hypothetical protein [Photorhabdus laumondii subsp. laumondii]NDL30214.1 hypothetical protein [Photorhabdus laumondii subsp. laumondii]